MPQTPTQVFTMALRLCKYLVKIDYTLSPDDEEFSTQAFADAGWAGCATTRNNTTGVIVDILNSTIHRHSETQSMLATNSGESELCVLE